jgi:hypothetical protein
MLPPTEENVRSHSGGFLKGLRERGYLLGKSVQIDYRYAEYELERLPALAKELVALKPDVIVTTSPPGVRAAQQATREMPARPVHDHDDEVLAVSLRHLGQEQRHRLGVDPGAARGCPSRRRAG